MKNWKILLLVVLPVLLLSPTLKIALNSLASIFLIVVIVRFLYRFIKVFWVPLLFIAAVLYLYTN